MEEFEAVLRQRGEPNQKAKLCKFLRALHIDIVVKPEFRDARQRQELVNRLIANLEARPADFDGKEREWEELCLPGYIFIAGLYQRVPDMSQVPLNRSVGRLFRTVITVLLTQKKYTNSLNIDEKIFEAAIQNMIPEENPDCFYTMTSSTYYQILPTVFSHMLGKGPLTTKACQLVAELDREKVTFGLFSFTSEMYSVIMLKMRDEQNQWVPEEMSKGLRKLLEIGGMVSPSMSLLLFFHTWFCLQSAKMDARERMSARPLDHLELLLGLCDNTARLKFHELGRMFPWQVMIVFLSYMIRQDVTKAVSILPLLCNCFRRVGLDFTERYQRVVGELNETLIASYFSGKPFCVMYLLSSLDSSMRAMTMELTKIHAYAGRREDGIKDQVRTRRVRFSEQFHGSISRHEMDDSLFTKVTEEYFPTEESVTAYIGRLSVVCSRIQKRARSMMWYQDKITISVLHSDGNEQAGIALVNAALSLFGSLFDFMIELALRRSHVGSFENVSDWSLPVSVTKCQTAAYQSLQLSGYFRKLWRSVESFAGSYMSLIATDIANRVSVAIEKGSISMLFLHLMWEMGFENQQRETGEYRLMNLVAKKMMVLVIDKLRYIMAEPRDEVRFIHSLVCFTIRLATVSAQGSQNRNFGTTLKVFQRLVLQWVMWTLKMTPHHNLVLQMVRYYIAAVDEHYNPGFEVESTASARASQVSLEDVDEFVLMDNIGTILSLVAPKQASTIELGNIAALLEAGLRTHDKAGRKTAVDVLKRILGSNASDSISSSSQSVKKIFGHFFDCIATMDSSDGAELASFSSAFATRVLALPPVEAKSTGDFVIPELNLDVSKFLTAVLEKMDDSDEEISWMVVFVSNCFDYIIEQNISTTAEHPLMHPMQLLIFVLSRCATYESVKEYVNALSKRITQIFGKLFITGQSNLYILSLFHVIGRDRWKGMSHAPRLAHDFFDYCEKKGPIEHGFGIMSVESMFRVYDPRARIFSLLTGLSFFVRYYPMYITLDIVKAFLIQTTELVCPPTDPTFAKTLKRFIAEFLAKSDNSVHEEFVQMVARVITPLSVVVRTVLEGQLFKLKMPLSAATVADFENIPDPVVKQQRLTVAFLCGIAGPFTLTEWMKRCVTDSDSSQKTDKLCRTLSMYYAIIRNPALFDMFLATDHFLGTMLHLFLVALYSAAPQHPKAVVKKCFRVMNVKMMAGLAIPPQIEDYWRRPMKAIGDKGQFWGNSFVKISVYVLLTDLCPSKTPLEALRVFFKEVFSYAEKPDHEKAGLLSNFSHLLGLFAVKAYITRHDVQEEVLRDQGGKCYLDAYLDLIVRLMSLPDVPILTACRKNITPFLHCFALRAMKYLIATCRDPLMFNYILVEDLIMKSKDDLFAESFLLVLQGVTMESVVQPRVFKIIENMSDEPRFCQMDKFRMYVDHVFISNVKNLDEVQNRQDCSESVDYRYQNMTHIAYAGIKIALSVSGKNDRSKRITGLSHIFRIPFFAGSHLYRMFVDGTFKYGNDDMLIMIVNRIQSAETILKLPGCVFCSMVPQALKMVKGVPQEAVDKIWVALFVVLNQHNASGHYSVAGILKCVRYLLKLGNPKPENIETLLNSRTVGLKKWLLSPDPEIVLYSLKIAIKMSDMHLITLKFFDAMIRQLFSFSKFADFPYKIYFRQLVQANVPWMSELSDKTMSAVEFFMHDKHAGSHELRNVIETIFPHCEIMNRLPTSVFMVFLLHIRDKMKEGAKYVNEICDLLLFVNNLSSALGAEQDELWMLVEMEFMCMKLQLTSQRRLNDTKELLFKAFAKLPVTQYQKFPVDLLDKARECATPLAFAIIAAGALFVPQLMIEKERGCLIEAALQYTEEERVDIPLGELECIIDVVFGSSRVWEMYRKVYMHALDVQMSSMSIRTCERALLLVDRILSFPESGEFHRVVSLLWSTYEAIPPLQINVPLASRVFRTLLDVIGRLQGAAQDKYISQVIDKVVRKQSNMEIFSSRVIGIISSNRIVNAKKLRFMDRFTEMLGRGEKELLAVVKAVEKFGDDIGIDVRKYLVSVHLLRVKYGRCTEALSAFQAIFELLPSGVSERCEFLIQHMPVSIWSANTLLLVTACFAVEVPGITKPMLAFISRFSASGSDFVRTAFVRVINAGVSFQTLLASVLAQRNKRDYIPVIVAILEAYHEADKNLSASAVTNASKRVQTFLIDSAMKRSGSVLPSTRYILSGTCSDAIFGVFKPLMTNREIVPVALTLLNQYDAAESLYSSQTSTSPLFLKMKKINDHFVSPEVDARTFDAVVRPLLKIGTNGDTTVSTIHNALKKLSTDSRSGVVPLLMAMQKENMESIRTHVTVSQYEKERFVALDTVKTKIAKLSGAENVYSASSGLESCLNPVFMDIISSFTTIIAKVEESRELPVCIPSCRRAVVNSGSTASILMGPSMISVFTSVAGVTSRGMVALGRSEINEHFSEIAVKAAEESMESSDWIPFAAFCFNVFCARQTIECFSVTFGAYSAIIQTKNESMVVREEASARIITLVRIAAENRDPSFMRVVCDGHVIFGNEYRDVWRCWLQQLVGLSNVTMFFNIIAPLLVDAPHQTMLYARKIGSQSLIDSFTDLFSRFKRVLPPSSMDRLCVFIRDVASIDLDCLIRQGRFDNFMRESLRLSSESVMNMDLLHVRQKPNPITPFETALQFLTQSQIEMIGNFYEFVERIRGVAREEREEILRFYTKSTESLSRMRLHMAKSVESFNRELIRPMRCDGPQPVPLFRIHRNVTILSPHLLTFKAVTTIDSGQPFLVQIARGDRKVRRSTITTSTALLRLRRLMDGSYLVRSRGIRVPLFYSSDIGEDITFMPLRSDVTSMNRHFEADTMMTRQEWLAKNVTDDHLNEQGVQSVQNIQYNSIKRWGLASYRKASIDGFRTMIVGSWAAACLFRFLFRAEYQLLERTLITHSPGESLLLCSDFNGDLASPTSWSPIRTSPVIVSEIAGMMPGEFGLSISVVAHALVGHIETLRAFLELIIGDDIVDRPFAMDEILVARNAVEQRLLSLAPPARRDLDPEEGSEWMDTIDKLVARSSDPSIQPASAIPWY